MIGGILIVAAGLALMFGVKELAGHFMKAALGLALILTVLPALAGSCNGGGLALVIVALVLIGAFRAGSHGHKTDTKGSSSLKKRIEH